MRLHGGTQAERLARALDEQQGAGAHAAPPPVRDPELTALLEVAGRLTRVEPPAGPSAQFRSSTREMLVGLAAERFAQDTGAPVGSRRDRAAWRAELTWGRRALVAVAALAVLVGTAGGLSLASRDALPGDALYAAKRATERVQLGLTFDTDTRGVALLHLAEARLTEVTALLDEPTALSLTGTGDVRRGELVVAAAADSSVVVDTLAEMDRQTKAGVSLLTNSALDSSNVSTLSIVPGWADGQQALLGDLVPGMSPDERARAQNSLALLDRVAQRAEGWQQVQDCSCAPGVSRDDLGPVPCRPCLTGGSGGVSPTPTRPTSGAPATGGPPPSTSPAAGGDPASTPPPPPTTQPSPTS